MTLRRLRTAAGLALLLLAGPAQGQSGPELKLQHNPWNAAGNESIADSVVLVLTNEGIGTGSVLDAAGSIVTCVHAVLDYATVGVVFRPPPGTPLSEDMIVLADVVRTDPETGLVLLAPQEAQADRQPIRLGSLASLRPGETLPSGTVDRIGDGFIFLQPAFAPNPGNACGPVLDQRQRLVGVMTHRLDAALPKVLKIPSVERLRALLAAP